MTKKLDKQHYVVGVYDNSGTVTAVLEKIIRNDAFLEVNDNSNHEIGHSYIKDFFLNRCERLVVKIDSMSSMSFTTGGIRDLLASKIKKLYVLADSDFESILKAADDIEKIQLHNLKASGAFVVQPHFTETDAQNLIS